LNQGKLSASAASAARFPQPGCTQREEELPSLDLEPVTYRFHQMAGDTALEETAKFVPYSPSTHQSGFYSLL